jgi:NRPS condensation-like uncharacterized protein
MNIPRSTKPSRKTISTNQFWLPLDNAAKIYPATITSRVTTVFRIGAVLKRPVNARALMKSLSLIENRFQYFKVRLKKGFFWFYLEHVPLNIPVIVDNRIPCRKFPRDGLLFRVLILHNTISVEFSHILTDGAGAYEFLKTLLIVYAKEMNYPVDENFKYLHPGKDISEEEYEDSYKRYFQKNIPPMVKRPKAFHLPFALNVSPSFRVTHLNISVSSMKSILSKLEVSITDYLVAVYLYILQDIYYYHSGRRYKKNKHLRVQVPVNLRKIFPTRTMRNFSLFVLPEIDTRLGHYSFEEILKTVHHQMRLETDEKLIHKNISRNVGSERKIYIKSIPLFLKSLILRLKYYSLGTSQYSGVITNLGKAEIPVEIEDLIDKFIFIPPPPNKMLKINCGIISLGDKLIMSFGNTTKSSYLEEGVSKFLKTQGIKVKAQPEIIKKSENHEKL